MRENHRLIRLGVALSCVVSAVAASAQSNSIPFTNSPAAESSSAALRHEQDVRTACIEGRRLICGRILDLRPEGLIVESGYTNLLREPLSKSWLIPGTAVASRAENLIESKTPGAICVGRVLLTDTPKGKKAAKPAKYDYVIVEAYPAGQYTYTSTGTVRRTLRKFSASLLAAVQGTLAAEKKPQPSSAH
jgi:hypothetical protein